MKRRVSKYLCLAHGDAARWEALPRERQAALLARDAELRRAGGAVAAVRDPVVVTFVGAEARITPAGDAGGGGVLAGYYLLEAGDLQEVLELLSRTPCAAVGSYVVARVEDAE